MIKFSEKQLKIPRIRRCAHDTNGIFICGRTGNRYESGAYFQYQQAQLYYPGSIVGTGRNR